MKGESDFTKSKVGKATFIPFGSRLAPLTNAIMQRRYGKNTTVKKMLVWLAEQNVGCSREAYQKYIHRLLHHLPDAQAVEMGVDLPMLHAIRCRLRLPRGGSKLWRMPYHRGHRRQ